jgi:type I restriction enzyme, S subunit
MELKQVFKQTEVGVLPIVWDVVPFDEIANKHKKWSITGGPFGSNLKVSDYIVDGVQIIQLQNIGDGVFHDESQIFTSYEKANELLSCNIYAGEIILSKMGDPVARACFIPNKAERYVMASDGIRLVVDEAKFSKKFIHDYINSSYFRRRAFEISTGTTRQRIGLPELKTLLVICPPLHEQTAIANVLSDMDALISQTEKLIEKKKAIKRGAMQELLKPKEGWVTKKLGEILKFGSGKDYKHLSSGEIPVYGTGGLMTFVDDYLYDGFSVGIGRKGTIDKPVFLSGKFWTVDTLFYTHSFVDVNPKFIHNIFLLIKWKEFNEASGVPSLNKNTLESIQIVIPPISEQCEIVSILSDMDALILQTEAKLNKLKQQKHAMMQALLTGKIRLA